MEYFSITQNSQQSEYHLLCDDSEPKYQSAQQEEGGRGRTVSPSSGQSRLCNEDYGEEGEKSQEEEGWRRERKQKEKGKENPKKGREKKGKENRLWSHLELSSTQCLDQLWVSLLIFISKEVSQMSIKGSTEWASRPHPLPQRLEDHHGRGGRKIVRVRGSGWPQGNTVIRTQQRNSQLLQCAQELHKVKPEKVPAWQRATGHKTPLLTEMLLSNGSCWEENLFCQ